MGDRGARSRSRSRVRGADADRVLVTGAAGLLGRAAIRTLQAADIKVVACDRTARPQDIQGCLYVQCDLSDRAALQRACSLCTTVLHLGGVSGPGFVFDPPVPPSEVAHTNIMGTLNVLEAAVRCGVRRVIFASSVIVYWPVDRDKRWPTSTLQESAAVDSTETYGASKIACEQLCRAYASQGMVDTLSLRIGWVYGPGRTTNCPIEAMLRGAASETPEDHRRDFVFVDDVANALLLAVLHKGSFKGISLNVSGAHLPHSEVVSAVENASRRSVERKQVSPDATTIDPLLPPMDLSATKQHLGWEPHVGIMEGVRRYAEHLAATPVKSIKPTRRNLDAWLGLWRWDTPSCVRALEYYKFWGTLTDEQAEECATSCKEFRHVSISEEHLEIEFKAQDTTRNANFSYTIKTDGRPHEIDSFLRARANNSIKMNPTGCWAHWWEGSVLIMEQPCIVRDTPLVHRVTRELSGDALRCHELVTVMETGEELLRATHAYARVAEGT